MSPLPLITLFFVFFRVLTPPVAVIVDQDQERDNPDTKVVSEELHAGDNEDMKYFLIRYTAEESEETPQSKKKLLIVLPGGDGSAEFHPFVKRIAEHAAGPEYLVAQLVAPQWSEDQAQSIIWPTKKSPWPAMKFSTEEFAHAVIKEIDSRFSIDSEFIFTLSWSSGGPAAYAISLDSETRVAGSFVAMSVFKPGQLPDLENARGKAYYILHSPEDFIAMRFPEAARDQLAEHGATTKLQTYEGGHGWRGDIYANLRAGLEWLEIAVNKDQ